MQDENNPIDGTEPVPMPTSDPAPEPFPPFEETDVPEAHAPGLDLDNMKSFVLIGTAENGTPVRMMSPIMSFDDLAAYIAQLQVMLQIETTKSALDQYAKAQRAAATKQPTILRPIRGL